MIRATRQARCGLAALALLACGAAHAADAWPVHTPEVADPSFEERIDLLVRRGYDHPDRALQALRSIQPGTAPAAQRALLLAQGTVLAQSGREAEARQQAEALLAHARAHRDPQAEAAASLVQALLALNAARLDQAAPLAQAVLDMLEPGCPGLGAEPPAVLQGTAMAGAASCDYRSAWQALLILQQYARRKGVLVDATAAARAARDLAARAGDGYRLGSSSADLAWLTAASEGFDAAMPLLHQAQRLAARSGDPALQARTQLAEAQIAALRGDLDSVRRIAEMTLPLVRSADAPRLEASLLTFLSDAYAKQKRPADALRAAERGLPIARRYGDRRIELALSNNAGLAKIGLGRIAEGKRDLRRVEELLRSAGLNALRAEVLREYDQALAAAGDARGALELYHRERELNAQAMRDNREAALQQLQLRNQREREQRDIALLMRDNQLKSVALANRDLVLRMWAVAALALALTLVLAVLLYRRVRATRRQLVSSQAQLRVQSERDPLTLLANRRHFLSVMQAARAPGAPDHGFEGALLLVDIDHFKHVNDGHGHLVGDQVLCEVARRLSEAVRDSDLVVRWGGEEFLVLARHVPASMAETMAARVLHDIGDKPVMVNARAVPVTVSIGYAHFPLPPDVLPVAWEQAINLADMALYTAKNQGRNRAVGIVAAQAAAAPELRRIEADFDRAWHEGRVTLKVAPGPLATA